LLFYAITGGAFVGGIPISSASYDGTSVYTFNTVGFVSASIDPSLVNVQVYRSAYVGQFFNENNSTFEAGFLDRTRGAGSAPTYNKRANISANDVVAMGSMKVGSNVSGPNQIVFYGLTGDGPAGYNFSAIAERLYGTPSVVADQSEVVIFKGNDNGTAPGQDRIRLDATGYITFQTGNGTRTWVPGDSNNAPFKEGNLAMIIDNAQRVGIGGNPSTQLDITSDFHIAASSTAWNTTAGKGLYMKFSTVAGDNAGYI
jgi:hypothetical protein